jgi:hypothetical protein
MEPDGTVMVVMVVVVMVVVVMWWCVLSCNEETNPELQLEVTSVQVVPYGQLTFAWQNGEA